jgi:hypothetical protein
VTDRGGHRQQALPDPDTDTVDAAAAVQLQVKPPLQRVKDRLGELADRFEQVLLRMRCAVAVGGTQQRDAAFSEVSVELAGHVALVGDDRQAGPVGGQGGVVVQHRGQDLAFVDLRVGRRPGDREPGRGSDQVQA